MKTKVTTHDPYWHVLGLLSGLGFSILLLLSRLYPYDLDYIDVRVGSFIAPFQTLSWVEFFLTITVLGSGIGISLVALGSIYILHERYGAILRMFLILALTSTSVMLAKAFVERARPHLLPWISPLSTFSFPSAHAAFSTALYGTLAILSYRHVQGTGQRFFAIGIPLTLIVLISFSRIAISVHYATDVIAGILLGIFWISIVFMIPNTRF